MKNKQTKAFTLIELLVVVSLIATLVGILAVGQQKVKYHARNLRQKAEFHGMEISIELFATDFDNYPDSEIVEGDSTQVCGAQRLAEAMVGRDEEGFHPDSKWHPDLEVDEDLYFITTEPEKEENLKERKPLYFELKHSGLYMLEDLWGSSAVTTLQDTDCPVLTDVFNFNRATIDGETVRVGSPILYFKADSTKKFRVDKDTNQTVTDPTSTEYEQWVYNLDDNIELLNLTWLREIDEASPAAGNQTHYTMDPDNPSSQPDPGDGTLSAQYFYELLTQREDADRHFYKPYNPSTFILISAGWDGIYGTKDDITNFDY